MKDQPIPVISTFSDFPDHIEMGIDAIVAAEFLTPEQKNDILCNNAARFLRLDAAICRP